MLCLESHTLDALRGRRIVADQEAAAAVNISSSRNINSSSSNCGSSLSSDSSIRAVTAVAAVVAATNWSNTDRIAAVELAVTVPEAVSMQRSIFD